MTSGHTDSRLCMCNEALQMEGLGKRPKKRFEREGTSAEKIHARLYHCPVYERNMIPCHIRKRSGFREGLGEHDGANYGCDDTTIYRSATNKAWEVQLETYTLPVRKMSNSPILLPTLIFRHHTVLRGSIKTAKSVAMLGTLELFAKT